MRIVGGIYRGRKLNEFKGGRVRPTSDMVRESLFNILQFKIQNKTFLDMYCGTGAVGIEALSRGASKVIFNDFSRESLALTQSNLQRLGITDGVQLTGKDASAFYLTTTDKFDFIFLDPPYQDGVTDEFLDNLSTILTDDGVIIYENEVEFKGSPLKVVVADRRKYGRAHLTFFKKGE